MTTDCKNLYSKVTIIIPTLNEEAAIGKVIDEILRLGFPRENILVVDGGSTDRTVEIVKSRNVRVIYQKGKGKAMAVKTALDYVETPYVLLMDGDYTYPAEYICQMVKILEEGYDHVIGKRKWDDQSQNRIFRLGNRLLTSIFNVLFGTSLSDILSGMYASRTRLLMEVNFEMNHFSVESEIVAHMVNTGKSIAEIPIKYRKRLGDKKLGVLHGIGIAKDIVRLTWRYNPAYIIFMLGSLLLIPGLVLGGYVAYYYFIYGIKYYVKGIISVFLITTGLISFLLAIMVLYMKRIELRTRQKLETLEKMLRNTE